ncbi:MAG: GDSL-type esterase/lipase family protein, partial [Pseudonocardia sp.]|nr:GDSL-type esterase/lipase family protein [Pseudonocardia sp.]
WWNPLRGVVASAVLVCLLGAFAFTGDGAAARTTAYGAAAAVGTDASCTPEWVPAWRAAAQPAPTDPALAGRTLRMVVPPPVTGSQVRVRLSNAYGTTPMTVGTVSVGWSDGGAGLVEATMRPVAFAGRSGVEIAPGADVVSDPVSLVSEVGRALAVSMFLPVVPDVLTQHDVALETSYMSRPGDVALAGDGSAFVTPVWSWMVLAGVDVLAPRPVNTIVTIGDSITDGVGSGAGADERWSDALSRRLTAAGGAATMSVLNAGIAANRLLGPDRFDPDRFDPDRFDPDRFDADARAVRGATPSDRFERDVVASGASDVVLHIGTNDIAAGRSAADIVAGLVAFAEQARAASVRVLLTTITPSTHGAHGTQAAVATRDAVNAWVLTHGREHADGVVDFAAAVADPADPSRLAPVHDSGDGLHLSAAGYRALAEAVDPALLTGSPCLADPAPARVLVSAR